MEKLRVKWLVFGAYTEEIINENKKVCKEK